MDRIDHLIIWRVLNGWIASKTNPWDRAGVSEVRDNFVFHTVNELADWIRDNLKDEGINDETNTN